MNYRTMNVEGFEITGGMQKSAEKAFLESIRKDGAQSMVDMKRKLIKEGVPSDPAYRAADRLLQKMRKAKLVQWSPGLGWIVGEADSSENSQ